MKKVICIERVDGGISTAIIVREKFPEETEAEFLYACSRRILAAQLAEIWVNEEPIASANITEQSILISNELNKLEKTASLIKEASLRGVRIVGIISSNDLPKSRVYRNAWKAANNKIVHDIENCKKIHKELLRNARNVKLMELDVAYQIADEKDDKIEKQAIAAKKQFLRDVTADARIITAQTAEELELVLGLQLVEIKNLS